jgi:hypothetical protein
LGFIETEVERILDAAARARLILRLAGSLAVQRRCPRYGSLARKDRIYRDIDFAGYRREARDIRTLLIGLDYAEDREVFVVTEGRRAIFENAGNGLHVDVFYDRLDFCHVISLNQRLEVDSSTLPLAELLLAKMQIVKINEKDLIDTIVLLLEHPLGDADAEMVNMGRIAKLCAEDWGLWRTTTMNFEKVRRLADASPWLNESEKARIAAQVDTLLARLAAEPKPLAWRLRARVGDRVKWYKDVEEVT